MFSPNEPFSLSLFLSLSLSLFSDGKCRLTAINSFRYFLDNRGTFNGERPRTQAIVPRQRIAPPTLLWSLAAFIHPCHLEKRFPFERANTFAVEGARRFLNGHFRCNSLPATSADFFFYEQLSASLERKQRSTWIRSECWKREIGLYRIYHLDVGIYTRRNCTSCRQKESEKCRTVLWPCAHPTHVSGSVELHDHLHSLRLHLNRSGNTNVCFSQWFNTDILLFILYHDILTKQRNYLFYYNNEDIIIRRIIIILNTYLHSFVLPFCEIKFLQR